MLDPGDFEDDLRGTLLYNPITSNKDIGSMVWSISYDALSYTWGPMYDPYFDIEVPSTYSDDDLPQPKLPSSKYPQLTLDGVFHMPLRPNLDVALRHLRSPENAKFLWVDAVCINQADDIEKSYQVSIMQQIFARAEVVKIWLGARGRGTPAGMSVMKFLAKSTLEEPSPWAVSPEPDMRHGLEEVLGNEWFSRIWVVQEAAVSQKAIMMCGDDSFEWSNDPVQVRKFIRRIKYASISPQWDEAGLSKVNMSVFLQVLNLQMQHIERQRGQTFTLPPDILDIAYELRHRKATDRRDKLFAIMGLVDQKNGSTFQPDYSLNVEKVFQRLLDSIEI